MLDLARAMSPAQSPFFLSPIDPPDIHPDQNAEHVTRANQMGRRLMYHFYFRCVIQFLAQDFPDIFDLEAKFSQQSVGRDVRFRGS